MKIIAFEKETPGKTAEDFRPHLKSEAQRVWELQKAEIIREIYFTAETNEAVIVLECDTVEEAMVHLGSLPLVKNGLITFNYFTLKPYTGFERLFV